MAANGSKRRRLQGTLLLDKQPAGPQSHPELIARAARHFAVLGQRTDSTRARSAQADPWSLPADQCAVTIQMEAGGGGAAGAIAAVLVARASDPAVRSPIEAAHFCAVLLALDSAGWFSAAAFAGAAAGVFFEDCKLVAGRRPLFPARVLASLAAGHPRLIEKIFAGLNAAPARLLNRRLVIRLGADLAEFDAQVMAVAAAGGPTSPVAISIAEPTAALRALLEMAEIEFAVEAGTDIAGPGLLAGGGVARAVLDGYVAQACEDRALGCLEAVLAATRLGDDGAAATHPAVGPTTTLVVVVSEWVVSQPLPPRTGDPGRFLTLLRLAVRGLHATRGLGLLVGRAMRRSNRTMFSAVAVALAAVPGALTVLAAELGPAAKAAVGDLDEDRLRAILYFAQSLPAVPGWPGRSYSSWFKSEFKLMASAAPLGPSTEDEAAAETEHRAWFEPRRDMPILLEVLVATVPTDPVGALRAHAEYTRRALQTSAAVPVTGLTRKAVQDYLELAKTRLQDHGVDALGTDASKAADDTFRIIESFARSGKIPSMLTECYMFRQTYFRSQIVPLLLRPVSALSAASTLVAATSAQVLGEFEMARASLVGELRRTNRLPQHATGAPLESTTAAATADITTSTTTRTAPAPDAASARSPETIRLAAFASALDAFVSIATVASYSSEIVLKAAKELGTAAAVMATGMDDYTSPQESATAPALAAELRPGPGTEAARATMDRYAAIVLGPRPENARHLLDSVIMHRRLCYAVVGYAWALCWRQGPTLSDRHCQVLSSLALRLAVSGGLHGLDTGALIDYCRADTGPWMIWTCKWGCLITAEAATTTGKLSDRLCLITSWLLDRLSFAGRLHGSGCAWPLGSVAGKLAAAANRLVSTILPNPSAIPLRAWIDFELGVDPKTDWFTLAQRERYFRMHVLRWAGGGEIQPDVLRTVLQAGIGAATSNPAVVTSPSEALSGLLQFVTSAIPRAGLLTALVGIVEGWLDGREQTFAGNQDPNSARTVSRAMVQIIEQLPSTALIAAHSDTITESRTSFCDLISAVNRVVTAVLRLCAAADGCEAVLIDCVPIEVADLLVAVANSAARLADEPEQVFAGTVMSNRTVLATLVSSGSPGLMLDPWRSSKARTAVDKWHRWTADACASGTSSVREMSISLELDRAVPWPVAIGTGLCTRAVEATILGADCADRAAQAAAAVAASASFADPPPPADGPSLVYTTFVQTWGSLYCRWALAQSCNSREFIFDNSPGPPSDGTPTSLLDNRSWELRVESELCRLCRAALEFEPRAISELGVAGIGDDFCQRDADRAAAFFRVLSSDTNRARLAKRAPAEFVAAVAGSLCALCRCFEASNRQAVDPGYGEFPDIQWDPGLGLALRAAVNVALRAAPDMNRAAAGRREARLSQPAQRVLAHIAPDLLAAVPNML